MMSELQWYQELFAEVQPDDFDKAGFPDKMDMWIEKDGEKIRYWASVLINRAVNFRLNSGISKR